MEDSPGQRRMHDYMLRAFSWPHTANDVYTTVRSYRASVRNRVGPKLKRQLQLLPASDPLEFTAIDILGSLPRLADGNQYAIISNDRYSKLTRALPASKTSSVHVANVFIDSWIVP